MFGRRRRFAPPPPPSGRRGFFSSRQAVAAQPAPIPATTPEPVVDDGSVRNFEATTPEPPPNPNGSVFDDGSVRNFAPPNMKKGGKVSSASKRADGCAVRGKTKGKML